MYHVKENKSTYKLCGEPRKMKTTPSLVVIFLLIVIFQSNKLESGHARSTDQDTAKNNNTDINNTVTATEIVLKDKETSYGGGSGSFRWGWGGGGGGGGGVGGGGGDGGGRGWGWGGGGGGGGWYKWGCGGGGREGRGEFVKREYAECKGKGKCGGVKLECPQHCGGFCFYDCLILCKPHCRR